MNDDATDPISVEVAGWKLITSASEPPTASLYREHAELSEEFDEPGGRGGYGIFFAAIGRATDDWPGLVTTQKFRPSAGGFSPGVVVVPEAQTAFIGAGTRLLCYQYASGRWIRLWEDAADVGFWGWRRHGDVVMMSAEMELAAWSTSGPKLWTTFVEPPWSYEVINGAVKLEVMGTVSTFPVEFGPPALGPSKD